VTSRDRILGRIRAATAAGAAYAALPRPYLGTHHDPAAHDIVALFAERAADYRSKACTARAPCTFCSPADPGRPAPCGPMPWRERRCAGAPAVDLRASTSQTCVALTNRHVSVDQVNRR